MAGIYIHFPFCKSKCGYCDFFSITDSNFIISFLTYLKAEINLQKNYLENEIIETIYFGGGTPSLLSINDINDIIREIYNTFEVVENPEITLEANPDDLSDIFIHNLKNFTKINRLSVGIQSFYDDDLKLMNRRHTSNQAIESIASAKKVGFDNISVDLIYGLPNQTLERWKENVKKVLNLDVQHISAYNLTYEKGTKFYKLLKDRKITEIDDFMSLEQFKLLKYLSEKNGFEHYEISNYTKNKLYSKHNSSYWKQRKYLGIGPSAHSYNLISRQWNFADIKKYIKYLSEKKLPAEIEILDTNTKYNEYIMTSLRTMWGVNSDYIEHNFPSKYFNDFILNAKKYISRNIMKKINNQYVLTTEGIFISDSVISDFFIVS